MYFHQYTLFFSQMEQQASEHERGNSVCEENQRIYPLLLVAFKRLEEQQKLLKYLMRNNQINPLFVHHVTGNYKYLSIKLDTTLLTIETDCLVLSGSGPHDYCCAPKIWRKTNCVEIFFCLKRADRLLILCFAPARVEMRWKDEIYSHEYPMGLQSYVDKELESAIADFGWYERNTETQ